MNITIDKKLLFEAGQFTTVDALKTLTMSHSTNSDAITQSHIRTITISTYNKLPNVLSNTKKASNILLLTSSTHNSSHNSHKNDKLNTI